jgi:hypothetical protein
MIKFIKLPCVGKLLREKVNDFRLAIQADHTLVLLLLASISVYSADT